MIPIKVRRKYMVGKIQGSSKPSGANQKRDKSLHAYLFAAWIQHEPGRSMHAADKVRQKALPKKIMVVRVNGKTAWRWQ